LAKKRKILAVTGSRGEWGYIRPVLRKIDAHERLTYSLLATNMHLLPEFGASLREIVNEGFHVDQKIYMALDGYTNSSMAKSLGIFLTSFSDTLEHTQPDIILLAGDRGEQLMAAIAGAHVNIPVAHIQAGEVSGNIDGITRHAIARYAHIHFAANQDAADRLRQSGEEEFRIFTVGAPQLDDLLHSDYESAKDVAKHLNFDLDQPIVLLVQHPVTEQVRSVGEQIATTLSALAAVHFQTVIIYPNNDAGSAVIREKIDSFRGPWLRVERNVSRRFYSGLLRVASVIVGNSSSGILEAPSFELPCVNIGRRQQGRLQSDNVINVTHGKQEIIEAVQRAVRREFRKSLAGMKNPYGDGHASERIVEVLANCSIDERLIMKALTY
jgi:UDP-hydrolysing UDP-N-acetyl-D-glucosamine 2-epimerase